MTQTSTSVRRMLAAALGSVLALGARPAAAQTRFAWPDTVVQVSRYATVEQCLAAVGRMRAGLARREALTVWRDTVPRDPQYAMKPEPPLVQETARRCAARFVEPAANVRDFAPLLKLYLAAGRDSDATALVARRLAAVPAKHTREQVAVSDSAVDIYLRAHPVRLDAAEQILLGRARAGSDRIERIALYVRLMRAADNAGDTARARRAARWVVSVADSLTKAERESEAYEKLADGHGGDLMVLEAMQVLTGLPVMLDSLRRGTPALAALQRAMWARITKERPEALPLPVGEHAPAITADYWFPRAAAGTPHPAPGRVSLIAFVDHASCIGATLSGDVHESCAARFATLRRLSERFPALDVTILSRTHGSFLYVPPPAPADEAELVRRWIEPFGIQRATIAVSSTPFWNLPHPDGRRIDKPTPNETGYSFGKSWRPNGMFLVDQDGLIVVALGQGEQELSQFIDVLMHRGQGGADRAAK